MIKRKIISDKRGIVINKFLTLILVVLVVSSVLIFLYRVDINNFIMKLPGYSVPEEDERIIGGEDEKIPDSCLVVIGKIGAPEGGKAYISIGEEKTNLYWKDEKEDGEIKVFTGGLFDVEVANVVEGEVSLDPDFFIDSSGKVRFNVDSDIYRDVESHIDIFNLVKIHNSYYGGNNFLCKDKEDEVEFEDIEEFFSVVGCNGEFDSENDAHNRALLEFRGITGFGKSEFDPEDSEDIKNLKTIYVDNGGIVSDKKILREVYSEHEEKLKTVYDESGVGEVYFGNHINCKRIISVNRKSPYYHDIEGYYYVKTKDGSYYMYNTGSDMLKNYIIKLKSKKEVDNFEVTWEIINNNENDEIIFKIEFNKEVKDTGIFDNHQGFLNDLYYIETIDGYFYIYVNKYSTAYGGDNGYIKQLGSEEKLTDFRVTWNLFYDTYFYNDYYINNKKVISAYSSGPILHYIKTGIEDSGDYIYYVYDDIESAVNDYIKEVQSSSESYIEP